MLPFMYRGFIIQRNPSFARQYKFGYYSEDYDGPGDVRHGDCKLFCECIKDIDEWHEENNQTDI